jgi:hypothetical protein
LGEDGHGGDPKKMSAHCTRQRGRAAAGGLLYDCGIQQMPTST